jgi:hypothetical protein
MQKRTVAIAANCVKKSGAPLPKDRSVAPATFSGSLKKSEITSKEGQKKCSVTTVRPSKSRNIHANNIKWLNRGLQKHESLCSYTS